ncbi:hypothetical protein GBA52_028413 [Prunus armeniaca]|nr:hypothetical protein GBA52_028413 [Prunus armeniaca]
MVELTGPSASKKRLNVYLPNVAAQNKKQKKNPNKRIEQVLMISMKTREMVFIENLQRGKLCISAILKRILLCPIDPLQTSLNTTCT